MSAQDDLHTELHLQSELEIVEVDGAFRRFHGELHTGAEVNDVYGAPQILAHFGEQLDLQDGEPGQSPMSPRSARLHETFYVSVAFVRSALFLLTPTSKR